MNVIEQYIRDVEFRRHELIYQLLGPNIEYSMEIRNKIYRIQCWAQSFIDYDNELQLLYEMRSRQSIIDGHVQQI